VYRRGFFLGVGKINIMMGGLFYRNISPTEIENMSYSRLKYWYNWHKFLIDEENKIIEQARRK
jgi:hypothetical protein